MGNRDNRSTDSTSSQRCKVRGGETMARSAIKTKAKPWLKRA